MADQPSAQSSGQSNEQETLWASMTERYRHGDRLERQAVIAPVIALDEGRWMIWVCSRCGKQEHEFPHSTRHQIEGLRAGTWPTPGMRGVWPHNCGCGGVVREITVMVKQGQWSCPSCDADLGSPECEECEAANAA